ncbi:hypothetical protein [Endozoicomonas sp. SCSIO W0465]|uniref:hypothetical protein n=1 Tax=Endozoicomonas sp. SCSIO W0465 TaxID=2918516 RepID=UPI002075490D|nr:hypothetical protein [Endozoicomonas sp. SCSIO W0465]USE38673.1 hypothetical protein MJO57_11170 [Endozoicomonas sp. SCSIO W0465]
MLNTFEAKTDEQGNILVPSGIKLPEGCRILITVLDESPKHQVNDEALLSEKSLAADWDNPDEDEAWKSLNQD